MIKKHTHNKEHEHKSHHPHVHPPKTRWQKMVEPIPQPIRRICGSHWGKITIVLLILGTTTYGYFKITAEPEPEFITASVTKGDIAQAVEAVGTVVSERDLNLQFPLSGVVAEVLVDEGDFVQAGQRLASLRAGELSANVNSALASLQAAQADWQELVDGTRQEDIAIAEAEVENKRAALDAVREILRTSEDKLKILEAEADISLVGEVSTARSTASQKLTVASNALGVVDDVLDDRDVQDSLIYNYSADEAILRTKRRAAGISIQSLVGKMGGVTSATEARTYLDEVRSVVLDTSDILDSIFNLLVSLPPSSSFTRAERETRKSDVATERKSVQDALNAIDSAKKSLQDGSANFDTKITSEESSIARAKADILTYETSLRTQEAQLNLKRAGARQTEIDSAQARVRQEQADLDRARADYADTILKSPVAGTITQVNVKTGELLSTAFQQDAAITMLGESPYRIEMFISEIDIPKVILEQQSFVELDAFPDEPFELIVAEIDPAATMKDGVPKYRVKLDFVDAMGSLKIGMTGDVDIVTGGREDVLMVPARAVLERSDGSQYVRILQAENLVVEKSVETGLEGGMDIEVISGLQEGEEVVVLMKK